MNATSHAVASLPTAADRAWRWPIDPSHYNRRTELAALELQALHELGWRVRRRRGYDPDLPQWAVIRRLIRPLDDARAALGWCPDTQAHRRAVTDAIGLVLRRCLEEETSFWAWSSQTWLQLIGTDHVAFEAACPGDWIDGSVRPYVAAFAYLLGGFTDFEPLGGFNRRSLAWRVFGKDLVEDAVDQVTGTLQGWGYHPSAGAAGSFRTVLIQAMLINRSPLLQDLTSEALARIRQDPTNRADHTRGFFRGLHKALFALGHAGPPPRSIHAVMPDIEGVSESWEKMIERWYATSTLTPKVRGIYRGTMAKAARWLVTEYPEVTQPELWNRETCAAWVAAVDRLRVGDYVQRTAGLDRRGGKPLSAQTKAGYLNATRTFFRDVQGWIPRRFDPTRALATPRSIAALIGPNPRVIAEDVWAKLLWAGLNLEPEDCPTNSYGLCYPMELIRAVTLTWLFSGLRSDEIARLRVGCIRWQHDGVSIAGDAPGVLASDAVCLLDVPTHKTGTAFTKPVDPLLGQAIEAWDAVRPQQPAMLDRKTGEHVDLLFTHRAKRMAKTYINTAVIPSLCRKAGVPTTDVRGNITQPPGPLHDRHPALQRQGADDTVRAAGLARSPLRGHHTALRQDHTEHAVQGLPRRRLLRTQRPHHRGPGRPGRGRERRRGRRAAVAVLRPGARVLQLHLLRAVPAPDGLRQVRLLHPEGLLQGAAAGGQGQPAAHARRRSPHRR